MTTAIVFVLTEYLLPDAGIGINLCIANGWEMRGVVKDDWKKAMEYLSDGTADILIIADESHLDPDRVPRIEVAAHRPTNAGPRGAGPASSRNQRTRLIRRDAAS